MEIINYVIAFLAGFVTILLIKCAIFPICDAALYGLGYTIFNIKCTNRNKAMNALLRYVIVILKWYIIGFGERLIYETTGTHTIGNKRWRPYFHYK